MDVSVRELRNHTARVISAVESGQPVVLTVHGRPVAERIAGVSSPTSDFETGLEVGDTATR